MFLIWNVYWLQLGLSHVALAQCVCVCVRLMCTAVCYTARINALFNWLIKRYVWTRNYSIDRVITVYVMHCRCIYLRGGAEREKDYLMSDACWNRMLLFPSLVNCMRFTFISLLFQKRNIIFDIWRISSLFSILKAAQHVAYDAHRIFHMNGFDATRANEICAHVHTPLCRCSIKSIVKPITIGIAINQFVDVPMKWISFNSAHRKFTNWINAFCPYVSTYIAEIICLINVGQSARS